jgi:hypothetical protein
MLVFLDACISRWLLYFFFFFFFIGWRRRLRRQQISRRSRSGGRGSTSRMVAPVFPPSHGIIKHGDVECLLHPSWTYGLPCTEERRLLDHPGSGSHMIKSSTRIPPSGAIKSANMPGRSYNCQNRTSGDPLVRSFYLRDIRLNTNTTQATSCNRHWTACFPVHQNPL